LVLPSTSPSSTTRFSTLPIRLATLPSRLSMMPLLVSTRPCAPRRE
jgi:hypothetical protein